MFTIDVASNSALLAVAEKLAEQNSILSDGAITLKGEDGITPHIGENGNWYIGDTDTEVRAEALAEGATIVQTTGTSETDVMSQKGVSDALDAKEDTSNKSTVIDDSANDTNYPTTLAVKNHVKDSINVIYRICTNLFDISKVEEKTLVLNNGTIITNNHAFTTDYIPVVEGETYTFKVPKAQYGGSAGQIPCYDANKTFVKKVEGTYDDVTELCVLIIPQGENVVYIRTSTNNNDKDTFMIINSDTYPNEYIPFGKKHYFIPKSVEVYADGLKDETTLSPLKGKVITLNGDSICYGAGSTGGYGKIIADKYGMTLQNIARSGGTIAAETYASDGTTPRHWICRTIANMDSNADYAIIEGGVNDASVKPPLGTISDGLNATLDDTTFYGAFESMLKQLTLRFAGKKIGYIMVHQMHGDFSATGEDNYYWAAKKCCEKWGVPFLDLSVACPPFGLIFPSNTEMYPLREAYTHNADGWHPNEEGYKKYYVPKIEAWLKTL